MNPLPTACAECGATQRADGTWTPPAPQPSDPVSHGACPDCAANYRAELDRIKAAHTFQRRAVPTGGFKL